MKKKLRLLLLFALLTSLVIFAILEYQKQKQSEKVFTGTIEVTKADIMPKTSGYLEKLSVKEGDFVHKGQLAVRAVKNTNEKLFLMSSNILEK